MKKLLFVFLLISFSLISSAAQDSPALSAAWQVTKYDIAATLPTQPTDRNLTAKATINLKNVGRGAGTVVTFRINSAAEVIDAQVNSTSASFRKTTNDKLGELQRFTVSLPNSVQPNGALVATISYRLPVIENNGLTTISSIGSQFLPFAVWYPTPNNIYSPRGADYAPFRLQVSGLSGETIVSSGKASGTTFEQNLFAQPFFVSGSWDVIENANNVSIYLPKGAGADERKRAEELISFVNSTKSFASSLLGNIPDTPFRIVAVQRGAGFTDGGTMLLDYAAFRRQKIDAASAMAIAEAVIKVWLGNATAIRGDGYGVIKEGLTRFIATQFIEKQFGREIADVERLRQRISYVAVAKREDEPPLILNSPSFQTYFASVPNKGAMIWRLIGREIGEEKLFSVIRAELQNTTNDGLTLPLLREKLVSAGGDKLKNTLNHGFDQITDTDLLAGLPQLRGSSETVAALRNTGSLPVTVNVSATTDKSETLFATVIIAGKDFGEAVFKTNAKIVRIEIDPDKHYPQTDYANDFAPREITENDWSAVLATAYNRQDFQRGETIARKMLAIKPLFDDVRVWLGRILIEQNRFDEAEKEFNTVLNGKLLTAKSLAWANVGLGEIAVRRNQNSNAAQFFDFAVRADAEYASNIAARQGRLKTESAMRIDDSAKTFFAAFDKAVLAARKTEVENYVLAGELTSFTNRLVANQPEQWQTKVLRTEVLDANRIAVEINLTAKLLNKELTDGTALFNLVKTSAGWKLFAVDLFEVR